MFACNRFHTTSHDSQCPFPLKESPEIDIRTMTHSSAFLEHPLDKLSVINLFPKSLIVVEEASVFGHTQKIINPLQEIFCGCEVFIESINNLP
jgi:hypothetical protein